MSAKANTNGAAKAVKKNLSVGLETLVTTKANENVETSNTQFAFENLSTMNPADYWSKENVSTKFTKGGGAERELKVLEGLKTIEKMFEDPSALIIMLAKWWEVKPARNIIKEKLEDYCEENNIDSVEFLQETIRGEVDKLKELKSSIERLSYLLTYYKPREGKSKAKGKLMNIVINGKTMQIHKNVFENIKAEFGADKATFKAKVLEVAQPIQDLIEL